MVRGLGSRSWILRWLGPDENIIHPGRPLWGQGHPSSGTLGGKEEIVREIGGERTSWFIEIESPFISIRIGLINRIASEDNGVLLHHAQRGHESCRPCESFETEFQPDLFGIRLDVNPRSVKIMCYCSVQKIVSINEEKIGVWSLLWRSAIYLI